MDDVTVIQIIKNDIGELRSRINNMVLMINGVGDTEYLETRINKIEEALEKMNHQVYTKRIPHKCPVCVECCHESDVITCACLSCNGTGIIWDIRTKDSPPKPVNYECPACKCYSHYVGSDAKCSCQVCEGTGKVWGYCE